MNIINKSVHELKSKLNIVIVNTNALEWHIALTVWYSYSSFLVEEISAKTVATPQWDSVMDK